MDGWTVITLKHTLQELADQSKKARSLGRQPEKDLSVREWNGAVKSWGDAVAASVCREGSSHPIDLLALPNYLNVSVLILACDTYRSLLKNVITFSTTRKPKRSRALCVSTHQRTTKRSVDIKASDADKGRLRQKIDRSSGQLEKSRHIASFEPRTIYKRKSEESRSLTSFHKAS